MIKTIANVIFLLGLVSLKSYSMSFSIESSAFSSHAYIPSLYTCKGRDQSPPLSWKDSTANVQSYALIVNDPDAPSGNWVHWVLFNIPSSLHELSSGAGTPSGATSGTNSYGTTSYRGPCPPSGVHRYFFKLYALDTKLQLSESATAEDLEKAMANHILNSSELVGLFGKI